MVQSDAVTCSLSGSELGERVAQWSEVMARARSRRVESGRVVSTYPNDDALIGRIQGLIAAEAECCPFMAFSIEERPDDVVVELRVPDEMTEVVASMLARAFAPRHRGLRTR